MLTLSPPPFSVCDIPKLIQFIQHNPFPCFPKTVILFVIEVFSSVCQNSINW